MTSTTKAVTTATGTRAKVSLHDDDVEIVDWQAYIDAEDDSDSDEETEEEPVVLADLDGEGDSVLVAEGGMGGRGNIGESVYEYVYICMCIGRMS